VRPDLNGQLRLHERLQVTTACVGAEALPVLVIDNFLSAPQILLDYAESHCAFEGVSDTFYPGIRAPVPPIYCYAIRAFLGEVIGRTFGLEGSAVTGELGHFSLVTTPPANLDVLQRMPHFDNTNPRQLAVLHYLCGPEHGGTSFYRHRGTRFEFIDDARRPAYTHEIQQELASVGPLPARYICGDDPLFERTASFAAAFNRVLIYRSINLHSADIAPGFRFDGSPRSGRLTANTFFFYG
jgi:hypothetical protein